MNDTSADRILNRIADRLHVDEDCSQPRYRHLAAMSHGRVTPIDLEAGHDEYEITPSFHFQPGFQPASHADIAHFTEPR